MTLKPMKRIFAVTVKREIDSDGDTSWLGKYADKPTSEYAIDREKRGDWERGQFRYFNPACAPDGCNWDKTITRKDRKKYCDQDYERMERLNRGDWCFIGIVAKARVGVSFDGGNSHKIDHLSSGGLWGIESDSDEPYIKEVASEQLHELRQLLLAYGFGRTKVERAIKEANIEE